MYKLLIVDDEDFEREGMAQLIDWSGQEIDMVGTAWNGLDAFRKIEMLRPDMILTDIKMPVMDGIELIQKVRETYPNIEFAVLSGYGEYEYTSRAMEQGVKHYILKPCDEDKVIEVMGKVKKDIDVKRAQIRREEEYKKRMMPRAQQQLFRNLLLDREKENGGRIFPDFENDGEIPQNIRLLVFRSGESFDGLEEFVLGNMLEELLEAQKMMVYASTVVRNDAVILIPDTWPEKLVPIVRRIRKEFMKIRKEPVRTALSGSGDVDNLASLYRQTEELFRMGEELKNEVLLHYGMFEGKKQDADLLIDFAVVGKTQDYAELLQALQVTFLRMQQRNFSLLEKRNLMSLVLRLLYKESFAYEGDLSVEESGQGLMVAAARQIYSHSGKKDDDSKESLRYRQILEEIYRHFQDQKLCLHYLATDILYMNEDYLGRFFQKMGGKKFTKFLLDARIFAAEQLMCLESDVMVYQVSEMVGYASDGQYFSKIFKKSTGLTPSEYREKAQLERS